MSNIFDGLLFDSAAFVSYPRCSQTFLEDKNNAGCLITNFWRAFGFKTGRSGWDLIMSLDKATYDLHEMMDGTNSLFKQLGFKFSAEHVYSLYDRKDPKAVELIWKVIDKLPKGVQSDSHKDSEKASSCS